MGPLSVFYIWVCHWNNSSFAETDVWLRMQSKNRLPFFFGWWQNQLWPDSISYSTVAAWIISWGSGQKCLLIRLFAPAAHSWRAFASGFPVSEDCVSGRWELGGANPPDASHFYLDLSNCFSIILLQQKLLDVLITPFGRDVGSPLCKYHSSSSVYTGVINTPVCSPAVFRFIQT